MKMSKKCNTIWLVAYLIKSKTKINHGKALILAKKANSIRKLHLFSAFYFKVPTDNAQCSRPQQVKIGGEVAATTSIPREPMYLFTTYLPILTHIFLLPIPSYLPTTLALPLLCHNTQAKHSL